MAWPCLTTRLGLSEILMKHYTLGYFSQDLLS